MKARLFLQKTIRIPAIPFQFHSGPVPATAGDVPTSSGTCSSFQTWNGSFSYGKRVLSWFHRWDAWGETVRPGWDFGNLRISLTIFDDLWWDSYLFIQDSSWIMFGKPRQTDLWKFWICLTDLGHGNFLTCVSVLTGYLITLGLCGSKGMKLPPSWRLPRTKSVGLRSHWEAFRLLTPPANKINKHQICQFIKSTPAQSQITYIAMWLITCGIKGLNPHKTTIMRWLSHVKLPFLTTNQQGFFTRERGKISWFRLDSELVPPEMFHLALQGLFAQLDDHVTITLHLSPGGPASSLVNFSCGKTNAIWPYNIPTVWGWFDTHLWS